MRVLHIISEAPPTRSGFARSVECLSRELSKLGCKVDVVSARNIRHWKFGEIKLCYDFGRIYTLNLDGYDVVNIHGHTPTFSDNFLFSVKARARDKPLVYTFHCLVNFYLSPISKLYNKVMNYMIGLADRIVVTTPSYLSFVKFSDKVRLIPWGVDYDFFHNRREKTDGYNVLFVGQMRPYKGLGILLKAIRGLDLNLHIIGDGPDRYRYQTLARRLSLKNEYFYGNLDDVKLREFYSRCDVLAIPSVSENEAFGLVTLEAAAAGCAVIATDLPGLRDVVGPFGILVPPNDLNALRRALISLSREDVRSRYVEKGLREARKYSWEETGRKYAELYRELV